MSLPVDPYRHESVDGDDDWGVLHRHGNGAEPGREHPLVQHEPKHNKYLQYTVVPMSIIKLFVSKYLIVLSVVSWIRYVTESTLNQNTITDH